MRFENVLGRQAIGGQFTMAPASRILHTPTPLLEFLPDRFPDRAFNASRVTSLAGSRWGLSSRLGNLAKRAFWLTLAGMALVGLAATMSSAAPVVINNVTDLQNINNDLTGEYILGQDIDASETASWNGGAGFIPIGEIQQTAGGFTTAGRFTGVFDGQGHTITGLTINLGYWPSKGFLWPGGSIGLFSSSSGTIKNVILRDVNITGTATGYVLVGGLVGDNQDAGTISRCAVSGSINGSSGKFYSGMFGGVAGGNRGTIIESYSTASVNGLGVDTTFFTGSGGVYAGGLVGYHQAGQIKQAYATGPVIGVDEGNGIFGGGRGGLVGQSDAAISETYAAGLVSSSSEGDVSSVVAGGLIGGVSTGQTASSYWDPTSTGQASSAGGSSSTALKSGSLPTGFDPAVWGGIGNSYPFLLWQSSLPSLTPTSLDFGVVALGASVYKLLTVYNTSAQHLDCSCTTSDPFSVPAGCSPSLTPGSSISLQVRFSPQTPGPFQMRIEFACTANAFAIPVAGVALEVVGTVKKPTITTFSPSHTTPADLIEVTGKNFGPFPGSLSLGSSPIVPSFWSDAFVTFRLPDLNPGKYDLALTTSAGSAKKSLTVLGPAPLIAMLRPANAAPGSTVIIEGTNFGAEQGVVRLGTVPANIVSWTNTRIGFIVPTLARGSHQLTLQNQAASATAPFRVRDLLLVTERGACDESSLGTLAGTCWVLAPDVTAQRSTPLGTSVDVRVDNIRKRWYEISASSVGTSPIIHTTFLIGPDGRQSLDSEAIKGTRIGAGSEITFFADGQSPLALTMHFLDVVWTAVFGHTLPASSVDLAFDILSKPTSPLLDFGKDVGERLVAGDITGAVAKLLEMPAIAVDDPTFRADIQRLGMPASQVQLLQKAGKIIKLVAAIAIELQHLTAPAFDSVHMVAH